MDFVAGDLAMHGRQANMGWEGYVINSSEENQREDVFFARRLVAGRGRSSRRLRGDRGDNGRANRRLRVNRKGDGGYRGNSSEHGGGGGGKSNESRSHSSGSSATANGIRYDIRPFRCSNLCTQTHS